jgi:hypothetical protein
LSGTVLDYDDLPLNHMNQEKRHGGVRRSDTGAAGYDDKTVPRAVGRSDTGAAGYDVSSTKSSLKKIRWRSAVSRALK